MSASLSIGELKESYADDTVDPQHPVALSHTDNKQQAVESLPERFYLHVPSMTPHQAYAGQYRKR
jgi:hypothetical protein